MSPVFRGFFDPMDENKELIPVPEVAFNWFKEELDLPKTPSGKAEEEYIEMLSKAIGFMLNREFERLLQICYRIDLGEFKLKKILNESDPEMVALDLAKALWDRQKQKIETRRKYS